MNLKSKNPFLSSKSFANGNTTVYNADGSMVIDYNDTMTVNGAANKSFLLLFLLIASAVGSWALMGRGVNPYTLIIGGAIAGLVAVLVASFRPQLSPYLAPAYAIMEGLFIGAVTLIFEVMQPGIAVNAVLATFVTFIVCFLLYRFRIVKVTEQFKSIVVAATFAIATYYLVSWLFSMFTSFEPVHYGSSLMSIGISVFVIIIAALNLFLDFNMIEEGAQKKLPKYMEWFGAMGLIITLVWLYVEFLRLLSKLSRD
ncbi:Bax inhibitor-1/YccA family protein [Flavobacterium rhizosphaerae]|uniref:Bax inhibitor-1/YccA family protein n=1 Tax=Flavobacterium rhizosphaerae TaxID=3163298 RepID=A0ABW8YXL7_9FLAO